MLRYKIKLRCVGERYKISKSELYFAYEDEGKYQRNISFL
jgi:hypothetical protein